MLFRSPTEAQRRFHGIDDEAAERALDLYDAGMSREAIAKITGLKEHQITQYAKTAGIIRTTKEAARNRFDNPLHHLARQRKRKIRKWQWCRHSARARLLRTSFRPRRAHRQRKSPNSRAVFWAKMVLARLSRCQRFMACIVGSGRWCVKRRPSLPRTGAS